MMRSANARPALRDRTCVEMAERSSVRRRQDRRHSDRRRARRRRACGRHRHRRQLPPPSGRHAYPATDLAAEGADMSAESLFGRCPRTMPRRLAQWRRGAGFAAIRADWIARAAGIGGDMRVRLPGRELVGRGEALDEQGRLLLRLADGSVQAIAAGEVFPLRARLPASGDGALRLMRRQRTRVRAARRHRRDRDEILRSTASATGAPAMADRRLRRCRSPPRSICPASI